MIIGLHRLIRRFSRSLPRCPRVATLRIAFAVDETGPIAISPASRLATAGEDIETSELERDREQLAGRSWFLNQTQDHADP